MVKGKVIFVVLLLFILLGFWFRYVGITEQLSFWNDENHAAIYARGVAWHGYPVNEHGVGTRIYQAAFYYISGIFFMLFGVNEFAGRLPSVIIGTGLIGLIFYVTKRFMNERAGIVAAFLMAFAQMQLAWSTQMRPYIWIEGFTLLITYFCYLTAKNKKIIDTPLIIASVLSLVSGLFHGIGLMHFALVAITIAYKAIVLKKYSYLAAGLLFAPIIYAVMYFSIREKADLNTLLFSFNFDLLHYRVFLQANYWWLIMGAGIGTLYLYFKNKTLAFLLPTFTAVIFAIAIFKINSGYVRYSLPAFPLLYILFSIGIVAFAEYVVSFIRNKTVATVALALILIAVCIGLTKTNKVLTKPQKYYTINGDMRENPIVDYKTAYKKIEELSKGRESFIVMDAWNDRMQWYMPEKKYVWLLNSGQGETYYLHGEKIIGTVDLFEKEKSKYKSGVVVVENWESLTPHNLQQHIRQTLKKEFDVQNLPHNEADKWSITVYSWGI